MKAYSKVIKFWCVISILLIGLSCKHAKHRANSTPAPKTTEYPQPASEDNTAVKKHQLDSLRKIRNNNNGE